MEHGEIAEIVGRVDEIRLHTLWLTALTLYPSKEVALAQRDLAIEARKQGRYFSFLQEQLQAAAATWDPFRLWILWLAAATVSAHDVSGEMMFETGEIE